MAIAVQCEKCGKAFSLPDRLAGKRGRCDQCGHVFWINAFGQGDDLNSASASDSAVPLADVEPVAVAAVAQQQSAHDTAMAGAARKARSGNTSMAGVSAKRVSPGDTAMPGAAPRQPSSGGTSVAGRRVSAIDARVEGLAPKRALPSSPVHIVVPDPNALNAPVGRKYGERLPGDPFKFPKVGLVDRWLPVVLIVVGYGLPMFIASKAYHHAPTHHNLLGMLSLVLRILVIIPAALIGASIGGRIKNYDLPERAVVRMAAVLGLPMVCTSWAAPPIGLWTSYVLSGWLLGMVPACLAFWFLFRLTRREIIVGFLLSMFMAIITANAVGWGLAKIDAAQGGHHAAPAAVAPH
jgi:hypothetical protein